MTSVVKEPSGKLDSDEVSTRIHRLSLKVGEAKRTLSEYVETHYEEFNVHWKKTLDLAKSVQDLTQEMSAVQEKISNNVLQQLRSSTTEFESLSQQFRETKIALEILEHLVAIQEHLEKAQEAQLKSNLLDMARQLKTAEKLVGDGTTGESELKVLGAMRRELVVQREQLLYNLGEVWKESLVWEETESDTHTRTTCFSVLPSKSLCFGDILEALSLHGELDFKLRRLATRCMSSIFHPILVHETNVVACGPKFLQVTVKVDSQHPGFSNVVEQLTTAFCFYASAFHTDTTNFMERFGNALAPEFCPIFLRECVLATLPDSSSELDRYSDVLQQLSKFQEHLKSIGFLSDANQHLLDEVQDVDVLFANHLASRLLGRTRALMKDDLQDTIEVGSDESAQSDSSSDLKNPFQFPRCHISKSIHKLLDLTMEALEEACNSSRFCAGRLIYAVRNVFEVYTCIIPLVHKESLAIIPQQAALVHNNSMYLAHNLLTLGSRYQPRLPPPFKDEGVGFIDLVPSLRSVGTNAFLEQMRHQRHQFYEILKEGFPTLSTASAPTAERALSQCLHQLGHLQRVWQPVLPRHVYLKAIGTLLNSILEELLIRITTVDDIPADSAVFLVTALGKFVDKAPQVFQDLDGNADVVGLGELSILVSRWDKFRELVIVLDASLKELEDRWGDGKGPLSLHFTPEELKQLVRALFQNTDRRAAVLASIKS